MTITDLSSLGAPPPPPPVDGEEFEDYRLAHLLWDTLAVYGPLTLEDSRNRMPGWAHNYREFVRYNPQYAGDTSTRVTVMADRWMHDHILARCLRNGWVVEEGDLLTTGQLPPEHEPLRELGGERKVRQALTQEAQQVALRYLIRKSQFARRKQLRTAVASLADNIRDTPPGLSPHGTGQQQPILLYHPHPNERPDDADDDYRVIVDGHNRMAACEHLGVTPWVQDLPPRVTLADALLIRIAMETHGSMKSESVEEYIARLARSGLSVRQIAAEVGVSKSTVHRVMASNRPAPGTPASRTPTDDEVARMVALRDQGWSQTDIGDELGRPQRTVSYHLAKYDAVQATPRPKMPRPESKASVLLATLARLGEATPREVYLAAGVERGNPAEMFGQFVKKGQAYVVRKRGRENVYAVTPAAEPHVEQQAEPRRRLQRWRSMVSDMRDMAAMEPRDEAVLAWLDAAPASLTV